MTNATLYKHMSQVLAEVRAIPKTGRNQFFKYDYMTADDIMTHLRDLLSKHGIAVFARMDGDPVSVEAGNTKGGQPRYRVVAKFVFTLACAETGASVECPWYGEAIDEQDKAFNKAATAAMKYWLMKTFLLTTGDEEQDTEFDGHHKPALQSRQNGATSPAPAPIATITSAAPQNAVNVTPLETDKRLCDSGGWSELWSQIAKNPAAYGYKSMTDARPRVNKSAEKGVINENMTVSEALDALKHRHDEPTGDTA